MGDYISREAAVTEVCDRGKFYDRIHDRFGGTSNICAAAHFEISELIMRLPAADVEPVRHGKWNIRLADEMTLCLECSVCGRKVDNIDLHHLLEAGEYGEACRRYPYCHCGAKMCLEGENNDD